MKIFYIVLIVFISINSLRAQEQTNEELPGLGNSNSGVPLILKKGSFLITPYYQYSQFKNLRMVSHSNKYEVVEGTATYDFPDDEIAEYNDNFKTEYTNNLVGIRFGYNFSKGISTSVFAGVNKFSAKSWISEENSQVVNTKYPSFTFGGTLNYFYQLQEKFFLIGYSSITYLNTSELQNENDAAEEIIASKIDALYWDADVALTYQFGKFFPYAGVGFTQLFLQKVTTEQIPVTDDYGNPFNNKVTFDSHFRGNGVYGFAGFEYKFLPSLTIYARGTFPNPVRITTGVKISLDF